MSIVKITSSPTNIGVAKSKFMLDAFEIVRKQPEMGEAKPSQAEPSIKYHDTIISAESFVNTMKYKKLADGFFIKRLN